MASVATPPYELPGVAVVHPAHLEGNPTLATEILPGPPPLTSVQQQILKRDPKKNGASYSYLPTSDPGTTYAGLMYATPPVVQHTPPAVSDGPRPKRARMDKSRPQRVRQLTATNLAPLEFIDADAVAPSPPPLTTLSEGDLTAPSDPMPALSRSVSASNGQKEPSPATNGRTRAAKDKGKAKAKENAAAVKVKEEPNTVSLLSPEPLQIQTGPLLGNEDHCSACRSIGSLVYCDGCPRAFHLLCLDPPMDPSELPDADSRWFCPCCAVRMNPPKRPPPSFLSPLVHSVQTTMPSEFQLPEDIRSFFKDVATGPQGGYVDNAGIKQLRLNRYGQLDDRDVQKLKDRNGAPVLCFRCGLSALSSSSSAPIPSSSTYQTDSISYRSAALSTDNWNGILTCDYCPLHWHMDCLDPPLQNVPPMGKKWMCPAHGSQVVPPKRRIPKANAPPIEVTRPGQFNNGNIEVIPMDPPVIPRKKVVVDEVLINGRKYRVPERFIILDFWNKVNGVPPPDGETDSVMSSPLTSISSLEDADEPIDISKMLSEPRLSTTSSEQIQAAELLFGLAGVNPSSSAKSLDPVSGPSIPAAAPAVETNGRTRRRGRAKNADSSTAPLAPTRAPSSRSLRSRTAKSVSRDSILSEAPKRTRVKMEVIDDESAFLNPIQTVTYPVSKASASTNMSGRKRRTRTRKGLGAPPAPDVEQPVVAQSNGESIVTNGGSISAHAPTADPPRSPLKISIRLPTSMRAPATAPKQVEQP